MANEVSVHQMIASVAAKQLAALTPFVTTVSREGENDFGRNVSGYGTGDTISVSVPSIGTVGNGSTVTTSDVKEAKVPLVLDIHKNTGFSLTSKEKTLDIKKLERVIQPRIAQLAAAVHNDLLLKVKGAVSNRVPSSANAQDDYYNASAFLTEFNAPSTDRFALVGSREKVRVGKSINNSWTANSDVHRTGAIGMLAGLDFTETGKLPTITNGSNVTGLQVAAIGVEGASTLAISSVNTNTFLKGQTFTVAGVFAVSELTGESLGYLRQFVVTANTTATGTSVVLPIYPALKVGKTVSALPAAAAAVTFVGTAGATLDNNLVYHRDAFRMAFCELEVPSDKVGYTLKKNGFSIRVYEGSDVTTDLQTTRVDIVCGLAVVRPDWAVWVTGV